MVCNAHQEVKYDKKMRQWPTYPKSLGVGEAFGRMAGKRKSVRDERANWATMCRLVVKRGNWKLWCCGENNHLL